MKKETANFLDRLCIEMFGAIAVLIYVAIFGLTPWRTTVLLFTFTALVTGYLVGKRAMATQLAKKEELKSKIKKGGK